MRANRYVSYLAAEIEPQALANARSFEREIEKTLDRIAQKSARGSSGFANAALGTGVNRNLSTISAGAARTRRDLDLLDAAQVKTARSTAIMSTSFSRAADALQIVQGPLGPIAGRLSALGQVLKSLSGFTLAGVLAGGGAFALGSIATSYQKMHDTLVPVIEDQRQLKTAMADVTAIAGRTHQALQPVAELYTQFVRVGKDAGLSQQRIARLTETVSKATKIGGGDPEAQRGAIIQFGQALTANFHGSGQELQSILEQTPALAQAIAKGLGTQTSKLKELAKEGQLSTDLVIKALERSADDIDERFGRMPPRIGKSLQDLTNNLAVFVGKMDEATGATTGVANALEFLATHVRGVVVAAGALGAAYSAKLFVGAVDGARAFVANLVTVGAKTRENAQFNQLFAATLNEAAVAGQAEAAAQVASAKEYQAQLQIQIGLIEKQIAAQTRAVEMARTLDAGMRTSGGTGSSQVLVRTYEDLNASERALIATNAQLAATDAELAAAEARLAAANQTVIVTTEELIAAETAAAASTGRLAGVKAVLSGAMTRLQGVAGGLVNFLGGPLGVAFTAAAVWTTLLATRTDAAKEAIDRFAGGEEALLAKLENTTGKMQEQAGAALQLARALREAGISKAEQSLRDTGNQLGSSLYAASLRVPIGSQDFRTLRQLGSSAQNNTLMPTRDIAAIQEIMKRRPDAFKGSLLTEMFGVSAGDTIKGIEGVTAAMIELNDERKKLADFDKRAGQKLAPLLGTGTGKGPSKSLLNAQARALAGGNQLQQARADLALAMKEGPREGETDDAYKQRIAGMIQSINGLVEAHKAAGRAKADERHQQALLNKEMREAEKGRDNAAKLAGIQDQYSEDTPIKRLDRIRDAAAAAKSKVDDLINERVGNKIFSKDDAKVVKDQIDAYSKMQERKPVQDSLNQAQAELNIQTLISKGLGDQAEFVRRKVELEKQVGPLTQDEEASIRQQIADQNRLNDIIDKRSALIENNARFLDGFRDTVAGSIKSLLEGDLLGSVKNFFKGIRENYLTAKANEITMKLIGDPGKKYRDEMTRGLNNSAENLTNSATDLGKSADALDTAANALTTAAGGGSKAASSLIRTNNGTFDAALFGQLLDELDYGFGKMAKPGPTIEPGAIVITGARPKGSPVQGIDQIFGQQMGSFGGSLASLGIGAVNSIFGDVGKLGNYKGSGISDALGGIAQSVGQAIPEFGAAMAVTSVVSKVLGLKNFAGGAFGIGGNLIAKLLGFGKAKTGVATITNLSGSYGVGGNDSSSKKAAGGAADSVVSGLQRIADALGASVGAFAVSIGLRHGDYRVDPTGQGGTKHAVDFNQDEEAAIRYAILDALQDGAIKGIREGTQRLLQSGQDLDKAIEKAVKFEGVFKALKKIKDPVGAAIDDLNTQFQDLIGIFNEAGASAQDWSQLQELYDLERADAIKQATQDTVSALTDFIQSMTSGSDSPLSRRTVYNNARTEVDKYRADIAAGKVVDQDALVKALDNFEQASQTLFGSRSQFYTDFQDILDLATKAKDNATAGTVTNPTLPGSPFDADGPWKQLVGGQATGNDLLTQIRDGVLALGAGGGGGGSSIDNLPFYSSGGGRETLSDRTALV